MKTKLENALCSHLFEFLLKVPNKDAPLHTIAQKGFRWNLQTLFFNLPCIILWKAMHDHVAQYKSSRSQCTRDLLDLLGKDTSGPRSFCLFASSNPVPQNKYFLVPIIQTAPFSDFLFFLPLYLETIWKGIGHIAKTFWTVTLRNKYGLGRWKSPFLSLSLGYNWDGKPTTSLKDSVGLS